MKKSKFLSLIFAGALALSLTACGGNDTTAQQTQTNVADASAIRKFATG